MTFIYLDNNATTQPAPQVADAMDEVNRQLWANPSSVHRFGQMVRQRIELARDAVAQLIACRPRDLIFTSGGTEANNTALLGTLRDCPGPRLLITTAIEHPAVREPAEYLAQCGVEVITLPVDADGLVAPASLEAVLRERTTAQSTTLVTIHWANNETGIIEPIPELAATVARFRAEYTDRRVLMHCDATQAVGKLPVNVREGDLATGLDMLTMAAHKFHGPKGVGALYLRRGVKLPPQQRGGPQERDRRGGTENTAGIIGMGVAAELAASFLADAGAIDRLRAMRDRFEQNIVAALPDTFIHSNASANTGGTTRGRLWNTSNLAFPRLEAEAILLGLSERGICASAGAACSSGSLEPSPILLAMGASETVAHGSVRFSLSRFTTDTEIDEASRIVPQVIQRIARTMPIQT